MDTNEYIKQYSQLYKDLATDDLSIYTDKYNYVAEPSSSEMSEQLELHMFWRIPLSAYLVSELERYLQMGVVFKANLDVYYSVDEKYWPLVKHLTGAELFCREARDTDFTWSMELYKKAPWHFDLTANICNSVDCLMIAPRPENSNGAQNVECLEYLRSIGVELGSIVNISAARGNLANLKYLRSCNINIDTGLQVAAMVGEVACFDYIYNNLSMPGGKCVAGFTSELLIAAASNGHTACADYICKTLGTSPCSGIKYAAQFGHLECLMHLVNGTVQPYDMLHGAINGGHLDCVKYLYNITSYTSSTLYSALTANSLECFRYICERTTDWLGAIDYAVLLNKLDYVKCLYEHGAPWGKAPHTAVETGNIECFIYMHQRGASSDGCMRLAAIKGHVEFVKYLREHNEPYGDALNTAIKFGSYKVIRYIVDDI